MALVLLAVAAHYTPNQPLYKYPPLPVAVSQADLCTLLPDCTSFLPKQLEIHESPPPAAYHTATPVSEGKTVVFVGGGKNWGSSVVFLLDTVGLNWSSFETIGGGNGLSGPCCLHTAVAVTGEDLADRGDPQAHQADPTTSPASPAAEAPAGHVDAAAATEASGDAPDVRLWSPVGPTGRGEGPISARSTGSDKGTATGAAAAKKKSGTKEAAATAKKSASKEPDKKSRIDNPNPSHDNTDGGGVPEYDGGAPPVYESIIIFGGIVNEAAVSGVSFGGGRTRRIWTTRVTHHTKTTHKQRQLLRFAGNVHSKFIPLE